MTACLDVKLGLRHAIACCRAALVRALRGALYCIHVADMWYIKQRIFFPCIILYLHCHYDMLYCTVHFTIASLFACPCHLPCRCRPPSCYARMHARAARTHPSLSHAAGGRHAACGAEGLGYLHRVGLTHGNLRPSNMLVR